MLSSLLKGYVCFFLYKKYNNNIIVRYIPLAPNEVPLNITTINITSRSFSVSWRAPLFENRNGILRSYIINIIQESSGETQDIIITQGAYAQIGNLHPYYNYTYRIAAVTIAAGPFSEAQSVLTLEDGMYIYTDCSSLLFYMCLFSSVPGTPPLNFSALAVSSRSLLLNWQPPLLQDRNGLIIGYFINIVATELGVTFPSQNTTELEYLVNDLIPFTTYSCSVTAYTTIGIGPSTLPMLATTNEAGKLILLCNFGVYTHTELTFSSSAPSQPRNFQPSSVSSTNVTLNWDAPEHLNGNIRRYIIVVSETNTGRNFTVDHHQIQHLYFTVGNLHPHYTYKFSIRAFTITSGPPSKTLNVTMEQDS